MPKYTDSVPAQIGITTANSILAVLNVVGNSLVCLVVIRHQDMRYESDKFNICIPQRLVGSKNQITRDSLAMIYNSQDKKSSAGTLWHSEFTFKYY